MNAEVDIPAAAAGLTEEQRWNAAVDVIQQLGDPHTAARVRSERNNWYRVQRVIQVSSQQWQQQQPYGSSALLCLGAPLHPLEPRVLML